MNRPKRVSQEIKVNNARHATLTLIMFAGTFLYSQPAISQQASSIGGDKGSFAQLRKCRAITDIATKAACYDAAMDTIERVAQGGKISIITDSQIENLERDAFGFNLPSLPKLRLPTLIDVQKHAIETGSNNAQGKGAGRVVRKDKKGEIVRIAFDLDRMEERPNGRMRFVLANGQSWLQTDSSQIRVSKRRAKFVEIRKGAIGSYLLRINGEKNAIRVKREN